MHCKVRDLNIEYKILGEGKPIVVLHKSMIRSFEPVIDKRDGWKRIYINYPGIGETEVREWIKSSDDILDVVLESINQIVGEEKFLLVGFSYSCYLIRGIIQRMQKQVDGVAMICPLIIADKLDRNTPAQKIIFRDEEFCSTLKVDEINEINHLAVQDRYTLTKVHEFSKTDYINFNLDFYNNMKNRGKYKYSFNVDKLQEPFKKPSLIIVGLQDDVVGFKDAWNIIDNYPRATFAVLDMASHHLPTEQEHLFNTLVSDWLDRIEKGYYSNLILE